MQDELHLYQFLQFKSLEPSALWRKTSHGLGVILGSHEM